MRNRLLTLAATVCLAASATGCKDTTPPASSGGGGAGGLSITASDAVVVANGTNTVTISVTNTTGSSATLTTDRGTFPASATTATVTGTTGTVVLTTCNATTPGCTGTAHVSAVAGTATDSVTVTFGTLDALCAADCTIDAGCVGRACTATSGGTCSATPVSACTASGGGGGGGGGTTTGKVVTVTPARTRLPPNGTATTSVVVKVTTDDAATSGAAVTIATTAGTLSATTGTTGADGTVTVTLTAPSTAGTATITATATAAPTATGTATVTFPQLGALAFADPPAQYAVMGVKGSGWKELGWLQIKALDDTGAPYPDGLAIRFQHQQLGGSTFPAPQNDAACTPAARCVYTQISTTSGAGTADSAGLAAAWLYSGNVAGTLKVTGSATIAGVTRTIDLPTVAVVGAKANGANFSVVCGPRNVPALAETDCAVSFVDAPYTCVAMLKDRFGNLLGRDTQVIFSSEASAVGQIATTPPYDPAADPASQPDLGSAVQIFNTLGAGLPFDVAPDTATSEPSTVHGYDGCGSRTHNPRDGVATILAVADGEEGFFDANGNGVYDGGEPFVDQGEPFVDTNDNGQWDSGEWFLDVDGSTTYTARNGAWDTNTKIWTQTVVVYTGDAVTVPGGGTNLLGARWAATGVAGCTPTPPDPGANVTHKVTGPPEIPATWEDHYVYASDLNLNMLHAGAGYDAKVEVGTFAAKYWGLKGYADSLGFFYRYWPCDNAGANCASQCRVTGAGLPCLMKPTVTAFSCGPVAAVTITGADKAESGSVSWNVDTPYSVYGTDKTALFRALLHVAVTAPP